MIMYGWTYEGADTFFFLPPETKGPTAEVEDPVAEG